MNALRLAVGSLAILVLSLAGSAAAATLTVDTTSDLVAGDGACSLREAIEAANGTPHADCGAASVGFDSIEFAIPGAGPHTLTVGTTPLPELIEPALIDGLSQPANGGAAANCSAGPLLVELVRSSTSGSNTVLRLGPGSDGSLVRGVVFRGPSGMIGLAVTASDNRVSCNFFGSNATGSGVAAPGALSTGVLLAGASHRNVIGTNGDGLGDADEGNLFVVQDSATAFTCGISLFGGSGSPLVDNRIAGNRIGTNLAGAAAMPGVVQTSGNEPVGVCLDDAERTTIGTNGDGVSDALEGNVISGLHSPTGGSAAGIRLRFRSRENVIAGNRIGTDASGTVALGNDVGVLLAEVDDNLVGTNGDGVSDLLERNLISAHVHQTQPGVGRGVLILGGSGHRVAGNFIGTDITGTLPLGNWIGVEISDGAQHVVGTDGDGVGDAVEGNLLSGNGRNAVFLRGSLATANRVAGNLIGTDPTGTFAVANGTGVEVELDAGSNVIGTDGDGTSDELERNVIAGNSVRAITLTSGAANRIAGNFIGTTASGTAALHNTSPVLATVQIQGGSSASVVGSNDAPPDPFEGNLIVSPVTGLHVGGAGTVVSGNRFGSDWTGSYGLGAGGNVGLQLATGVAALVRDNWFQFHTFGVTLDPGASFANALPGGSSENNCVVDNTLGVFGATVATTFEQNWWGAASGPNPPGSGDSAAALVDATPFLAAPPPGCRLRALTQADLAITKTDGVALAAAGGTLTYTIVVSNAGPGAVVDALVADTFPPELAGVTWTCVGALGGSCAAAGSGDLAELVDLPVGASVTFSVSAPILPTATGTVVNTATVTPPADRLDPDGSDNSATDLTELTNGADLAITKTDGLATAVPGQVITYTLVASNAGPNPVVGAIVADDLPTVLTAVTWTCTPSGAAVCAANGSGDLAEMVDLPVGDSVTFQVSGTLAANAAGVITNAASVSPPAGVADPDPSDDVASDDTAVLAADLSISKSDGVATAVPGGTVVYTVVVANPGPAAATGAAVSDNFPGVLACSWTCAPSGGATCSGGAGLLGETIDLPVGASATYAITCSVAAGATGTLTNTATVTSPVGLPDPNPGNNSATDSDTLTPQADLSVTKSNGPAPAVPGTTTVYTVTFANAGPSNEPAATLADNFPAACTSTSWTCAAAGGASCPAAAGTGDLAAVVALPAGSSLTYLASCALDPAATGPLSNTASIVASVSDPTPGNNTATDNDVLARQHDLSVTKTDGVATATPGGSTVYTVVVANPGPSVATAAFSDLAPASCTTFTWTCAAAGGASCPTAAGSGDITYPSLELPPGSSLTHLATCTLPASASGTLFNLASVATGSGDPDPSNDTQSDSDLLVPAADLALTKTNGVATVTAGTNTTYTITVRNPAGPSDVPLATVTDTFPAACTSVTWTCTGAFGGSCTTPAGAGNLNHAVTLPVGGEVTFSALCAIASNASGTLVNTASVSGPVDPVPGNDSATDSDPVAIVADLAISKSDGVATATPGEVVTYTLVASNVGPSADGAALLSDTFPAACTAVTWTCSALGGASCPAPAGSGNLAAVLGLPVGGSVTVLATCSLDPGATGTLANTATITASGSDPDPSDDSASDTATLVPEVDLGVTKADGLATIAPGETTTYQIVVTNAGPSNEPSAALVDTFPAACSSVSWTCSASGGGGCPAAAGSGNLALSLGVPVGATVTVQAACLVSPSATGVLTNTATVGSPRDSQPANDQATDNTTLVPAADLAISKTDGVTQVAPGQTTTYSIVASNLGPSDAPTAQVTDTFPAGCGSVSWTCTGSGGGVCPAAAGSGNLAAAVALPAGGSVTFAASCSLPAATPPGTLTNTAVVTSLIDGNPSNDSATDSDQIVPAADLTVTKVTAAPTANAGDAIGFTVTVRNGGPSLAAGVAVADVLPPALLAASWTCIATGGATCTANGAGSIADSVTLPVGGQVVYTVLATIDPLFSGNLVNTASAAGGAGSVDPSPGDNQATATVTVSGRPTDIPTLGEWVLVLFALGLGGIAARTLGRREELRVR